MASATVDFSGSAPGPVDPDLHWIDGTDPAEPPFQVQRVNAHTFIIRQSLRTSAEGPFVYLFLGNERAVLFDTGDSSDPAVWPLRDVVDGLLREWLDKHPRGDYRLLVAHTHSHADHFAGDTQFSSRPATTIVGTALAQVQEAFGFQDWPQEDATLDLGDRQLQLIPSPGHHSTAISIYDAYTGLLLTGDTVYPGRLYVEDMGAFMTTMNRLAALAEQQPVAGILGCHIEMSQAVGEDYPLGVPSHPNERALVMTAGQLAAVRDGALAVAEEPGIHVFDDFILYNRVDA